MTGMDMEKDGIDGAGIDGTGAEPMVMDAEGTVAVPKRRSPLPRWYGITAERDDRRQAEGVRA